MRPVIVSAMVMLFVSGCAADPQERPDASDATSSAIVAQEWAGELCAATDALQAQVAGIATSLDFDPTAGLDQLPQIYAQLEEGVAQLEVGVDSVESVLRSVPASSPEAVAFATQVQTLVQSARSSGEAALASAGQALSADNFLGAGLAAAGSIAAAQQAYDDANAALELVRGARNGQDPKLQEAFAGAPECRSTP